MSLYGLNRGQWHQVIAAWSGWLMDGYVSISYLLLVGVVSILLFPSGFTGFIATVSAFVVGAIARSFGSLFLGNYLGDRIGRKRLLVISIIGFSAFSASLGLLPTYASAGIAVPVILYILVFIEGMFGGAEYGGGTALSMESIPPERRGMVGAFVQSGFGAGFLIAALVLNLIASVTSLVAVGWRIMFLSTLIPGIIILAVRFGVSETEVFSDMSYKGEVEKAPIGALFRESGRPMIIALVITSALLYVNSATFSFWPIYLSSYVKLGVTTYTFYILLINFISLFGVLLGGALINRIGGRRRPMLIYAVIFTFLIIPLTYFSLSGNPAAYVTAMGVIAFTEAMIFSAIPALLSETFSKRYRVTATGFAYNGGNIAGSWAVSIIPLMAAVLGIGTAWVVNVVIACIILVAGIAVSRETWVAGKDEISR